MAFKNRSSRSLVSTFISRCHLPS